MIHEEICTYEVAKLAKEKGFNLHCVPFYALEDFTAEYVDDVGEFYEVDFEKGYLYLNYPVRGLLYEDKMLPAPTQSLLQRWLREAHNLHTDVGVWEDCDEDADGLCCGTYSYWSFNIQSCLTGDLIYEEFEHRYDTYEQALEDALKYALENLVI